MQPGRVLLSLSVALAQRRPFAPRAVPAACTGADDVGVSDFARRVAADLLGHATAGGGRVSPAHPRPHDRVAGPDPSGPGRAGMSELLSRAVSRATEALSRDPFPGCAGGDSSLAVTAPVGASAPAPAPGGVVASLSGMHGCLELARGVWADVVHPGSVVIDATCGNGHDAAHLAVLASGSAASPGWLLALDVQAAAVDATRARVAAALAGVPHPVTVDVRCASHATFPDDVLNRGNVSLVAYNLGYLPGASHELTTHTATTLQSLEAACALVGVGGAVTVMCYPGHDEGRGEAEAVCELLAGLSKAEWRVLVSRPIQNDREKFLVTALRRRPNGVRRGPSHF